jgi:asparagine synthase (glutamine-hydrolysing)
MTAFAAILATSGRPLDRSSTAAVARALSDVAGTETGLIDQGECSLLLAPLHATDPPQPMSDDDTGTTAAGQVLLEGASELARQASAPEGFSALSLLGRAYRQWGGTFTNHLAGEYAFALWDLSGRTLYCARDGLGVRSLYVAEGLGTLIVTNVLDAAVAHPEIPARLDDTALVEFLAHGGPADQVRTVYRAVRVLPAGHTLVIRPGGAPELRRHWTFPKPEPIRSIDRHAALERYRGVLERAVADRVQGRAAALFLSGGVDSTTIAAAARQAAPSARLRAFTVVYRRFSEIDELSFAQRAADALGIPITILDGDRHEALDAGTDGAGTPEPLDEPTLADWRDVVRCAAAHATVGLYGEDGDAVFMPPGGRPLSRAGALTVAAASVRYALTARRLPYLGLRLRERSRRSRRNAAASPAHPSWLTADALHVLARAEPASVLGLRPEPLPPHPFRPDTQSRLLETVPRGLAATVSAEVTRQRIEMRFPLLDSRLLEFVMAIPPIPWCQNKTLPRAAYRGVLPQAVLDRSKTPVTGFYEALVASWRRPSGPIRVTPAIAAWIDPQKWEEIQRHGGWRDVMCAWRVLELDRWMSTHSAKSGDTSCTR